MTANIVVDPAGSDCPFEDQDTTCRLAKVLGGYLCCVYPGGNRNDCPLKKMGTVTLELK